MYMLPRYSARQSRVSMGYLNQMYAFFKSTWRIIMRDSIYMEISNLARNVKFKARCI